MSKVINIINEDFKTEVLDSKIPVLTDFWAPWCQPCLMMAPILEELSTLMDGKIKIAKIDTGKIENEKLTAEYHIQSIPNMKLFKDGKVIKEFIGMRDLNTIKAEIEEAIND